MSYPEKIEFHLFSDIGMQEIFMSRLCDIPNIFFNGFCWNMDKKQKIQDALLNWVIFDGLEPAFRSLRELRIKWTDKNVSQKEKEQLLENIYMYLTRAFKDRLQIVVELMGYKIGFLYKDDKNFQLGCVNFLKENPEVNPDFIQMLKDDRTTWSDYMIKTRNFALEHTIGNDITKIKNLKSRMNLETAEKIFENCWMAIEDIIYLLAISKIDSKFKMVIWELPEYRKGINVHTRFGWYSTEKIT